MSLKTKKVVAYSTLFNPTVMYVFEGEGGEGGGGGGEGGGNAGGGDDIQAKIDAAVAAAVTGLKTKNDELIGKLKDTNTKLKAFDGYDPEKLKSILSQMDNDEDLKLFQEGKKHEVIEKHTQRMRAAHDDELKAEREKTAAEARRADTYKSSVLDSQILAVTQGLHKGAVEDALLHARNMFSLDANGKAVQLNSDGSPVLGKDGKTPFGPAEWIEMQKELKPHWFPAGTSGGGSSGARDAGGGQGKTISRSDFDTLSPVKKAEVVRGGTKIID